MNIERNRLGLPNLSALSNKETDQNRLTNIGDNKNNALIILNNSAESRKK